MSRPDWFSRCAYGAGAAALHNGLTRRLPRAGTRRDDPWLINVAGTVGSGKSTMIRRLQEIIKEDYGLVQFDAIMEAYGGYRADVAKQGAERAFSRWEPVAWATGFDVMGTLARKRGSIMLELGASHDAHPDFLGAFSRNGYRTCMILLNTRLETCAKRARLRSVADGRHVPSDYVALRRRKIAALLPRYRKAVDLLLEVDEASPLDESAVLGFVRRA